MLFTVSLVCQTDKHHVAVHMNMSRATGERQATECLQPFNGTKEHTQHTRATSGITGVNNNGQPHRLILPPSKKPLTCFTQVQTQLYELVLLLANNLGYGLSTF